MDLKEVMGRKDVQRTFFQSNKTMVVRGGVSITLSCPMSFTSFPFDKQSCNLEFISPGMTPKLLAVNLKDTDDTLGYNLQVCLDL